MFKALIQIHQLLRLVEKVIHIFNVASLEFQQRKPSASLIKKPLQSIFISTYTGEVNKQK